MTVREQLEEIDVEALRTMLERGEPVTVLDTRRREEFAEWRIPGSQPLERTDAGGSDAGPDCAALPDDRPVVVVCQRGNSSREVARDLRSRCGADARSLEGGMAAWSFAWNRATVPDPEGRVQIVQLRRTGKGCLSYLAGTEEVAVVIDPSLDPEVYLREAEERGWTIAAVLDTHVHADHVSRARALAEAAGARLLLPAQERARFEHEGLGDGDELALGPLRLVALRVPGHTGESTAYLLDGRFLFTGDTLFLDGVGRPDLEGGGGDELRRRARTLRRSLERLTGLDDDVLVLPGHTAAPVPFDGEPLAASIGEVRSALPLLGADEEEFVERILDRIPPTPPNHERIVELNEGGVLPEEGLVDLEAGANRCAAG